MSSNRMNNEVVALSPMGNDQHSATPSPEMNRRGDCYNEHSLSSLMNGPDNSTQTANPSNLPYTSRVIAHIFLFVSYAVFISTFPFSLLFCLRIAYEWERLVIFRLGKLMGNGAKGPGLYFILSCIDDYSVVDLRTISFEVPSQEALTKDSVTVSVNAVLFYRIWLPTIAVSNVYDYAVATQLLTSTTLRNVIGTKTLSDVLAQREYISIDVRTILDDITKAWGVKVERVEIKDVRLPLNFQRSMAVEAEAAREARAMIVACDGEKKASHGLYEAANILSAAKYGMPLRYISNLTAINHSKETQILFPIPLPSIGISTFTPSPSPSPTHSPSTSNKFLGESFNINNVEDDGSSDGNNDDDDDDDDDDDIEV